MNNKRSKKSGRSYKKTRYDLLDKITWVKQIYLLHEKYSLSMKCPVYEMTLYDACDEMSQRPIILVSYLFRFTNLEKVFYIIDR